MGLLDFLVWLPDVLVWLPDFLVWLPDFLVGLLDFLVGLLDLLSGEGVFFPGRFLVFLNFDGAFISQHVIFKSKND